MTTRLLCAPISNCKIDLGVLLAVGNYGNGLSLVNRSTTFRIMRDTLLS